MVDVKLTIELTKEQLKQLMMHGNIHSISKTLDSEVRVVIKLRTRSLIPPHRIDEVFPL